MNNKRKPATIPLVPQVKQTLAQQIIDVLTRRKLNQTQAAELLETQQPRVSDLYQMRLDKFSIDMLFIWLERLEQPVVIDTHSMVSFSSNRKHLRLLLIEDNEADAILLFEELRNTRGIFIEIVRAGSLKEGATIFGTTEFDAVLLDLGLPDSQGVSTYTLARATLSGNVPIIVLTGMSDRDLPNELIRMGAENFLNKGDRNLGYVLGRSLFNALSRA